MKKLVAAIILAALLLSGCAGRDAGRSEPWVLPTIEPAPTAPPKSTPSRAEGSLSPEQYIWNEAESVNMSDPGAGEAAIPGEYSHEDSFALFEGQFLPDNIFNESYAKYSRLRLQKSTHQVLTDESGALAENAYVEYKFLPKNGDESKSLTVMAELCGYDRVMDIYSRSAYPHVYYPEGVTPRSSVYYLNYFMLFKVGETRYAQWLLLPSTYFSYAERVRSQAEDAGEAPDIQRQVLMTFTCGSQMGDEEFIAAVLAVYQYGSGVRSVPSDAPPTLAPGDKGYA